jgi:hypothetical protein
MTRNPCSRTGVPIAMFRGCLFLALVAGACGPPAPVPRRATPTLRPQRPRLVARPELTVDVRDDAPYAGLLFEDDDLPAVFGCPESAAADQPGAGTTRCVFPSAEITLRTPRAEVRFTAVLVVSDRLAEENDYWHETVVLIGRDPAGLAVAVHSYRQGDDVYWDSGHHLLARRVRAVDLDGDGSDELCIETLRASVGQDHVASKTREVSAFALRARTLVSAPRLSRQCPAEGYRALVTPPDGGGVFQWERVPDERRALLGSGG